MTLLLSFLGFGKSLFGAFAQWLSRRSLAEIVCIAMGLALTLDHLALLMSHRHAAKVETQLRREIASHAADRAAYVKAQADAAVANKAQVAKVEQQQQRVTDNVEAQYRADLARLERLRPSNAPPQRAPSAAGAPAPGTAASGPRSQAVPLPADELLRAQETELQLNALIDWVLQQSAVNPNAPVNSTGGK